MCAMAMAKKPHVLVIPAPTPGHSNPMFCLAKRLASLGVSVTFVDSGRMYSAEKGIKVLRLPSDGPVLSDDEALEGMKYLQDPCEQAVGPLFQEINPPCCVIGDYFLAWTQDLGNRFRVPRVAFWAASATTELMMSHLYLLISEGYIPVDKVKNRDNICLTPAFSKLNLRPEDLPMCMYHYTPFQDFAMNISKRLAEAKFFLISGVEEMELESIEIMRSIRSNDYLAIGPCVPLGSTTAYEDQHRGLFQWLDCRAPESVIYVSFGSHVTMSIDQMQNLAKGLLSSKIPFIWVCRPDLAQGDFVEFLESFKSSTKEQGIVITWAPQLQVLKHASVGGFLSHCGWNSTMESICSGVPMLCWPLGAEQNVNCNLIVQKWKVGLGLNYFQGRLMESSEIGDAIEELMKGSKREELAREALKLSKVVMGSLAYGGSSDLNLKSFVSDFLHQIALTPTANISFTIPPSNCSNF